MLPIAASILTLTLASALPPLIRAAQPIPGANGTLTCDAGQYLVYGEGEWDLLGSTTDGVTQFMSAFCNSSIGNTAVNCTGNDVGSTRRVLQGNGAYITEVLLNLTQREYGHLLEQTVYSVDPVVFNTSYIDFSHVSVIQVYVNQTTQAVQQKFYTNRCVSDPALGNSAISALSIKAHDYYLPAIEAFSTSLSPNSSSSAFTPASYPTSSSDSVSSSSYYSSSTAGGSSYASGTGDVTPSMKPRRLAGGF